MTVRAFFSMLLCGSGVGIANAQLPTVDISMVPLQDGRLEVRMRPDLAFDGLFASLVFTVQWQASSSSIVDGFTTAPPYDDVGMYPSFSNTTYEDGGYTYAVFTAFGFSPLSAVGASWVADQEFVLGHVDLIGSNLGFQLINDDWTAANNADYYVSLNGEGRTGVIYGGVTTLTPEINSITSGVRVLPNPTEQESLFTFMLPNAGSLSMEVIDAAGKLVVQRTVPVPAGLNTLVLDARSLAAGTYQVRIMAPDYKSTSPWVITRP